MKKALTELTLANLGYVEKITDIPIFLFNMFNDYNIIPIKQPFRSILAAFITILRAKETYKILKIKKSPLKAISQQQTEKLSKRIGIEVRTKFSYSWPFLKNETAVIPMFNFFSYTTHGEIFKHSKKVAPPFCIYPEFFDLVENYIEKAKKGCSKECAILLSAHSLPLKLLIQRKDPYKHDLEVFLNYLRKRLKQPVFLSFQSKLGPVEWLKPTTEETIIKLSKQFKTIIIVPISFSTDNTETVYEIDITYKNLASKLGVNLIRVECFNNKEEFIDLLATVYSSFFR